MRRCQCASIYGRLVESEVNSRKKSSASARASPDGALAPVSIMGAVARVRMVSSRRSAPLVQRSARKLPVIARLSRKSAIGGGRRVLNCFGGGGQKYAANPGLTPSFRRSLPETGCLSQGLPHGKCSTHLLSPKRLNTSGPPSGTAPRLRVV